MSNAERQRQFRERNPGYYGRLHRKRKAEIDARIAAAQAAEAALTLPAPAAPLMLPAPVEPLVFDFGQPHRELVKVTPAPAEPPRQRTASPLPETVAA